MGNIFNSIDNKICRSCGEEKPVLMFPIKEYRNNKAYLRAQCKQCYGPDRWANMSEEQRERKRERERTLINGEKAKNRMARANKSRSRRQNDAQIKENIGAFCLVQWHKCEKCGREQYLKNRQIEGVKCIRCQRTKFFTGTLLVKDATCPKCGVVHNAKFVNVMCAPCAKVAQSEAKRVARRAKGGRERSLLDRAKRHGVYIESVNKRKVYERDKHRCYVCNTKVVMCDDYQPNQATLDHIIPLSKGGSHTYDNVRTCCHRCNSNKANTIQHGVQISVFCSVSDGAAGQTGPGHG